MSENGECVIAASAMLALMNSGSIDKTELQASPDAIEALSDATRYRALASRDARFDGRFFTCVRTTGIFCRPICPARTPYRINVEFLPSAAAALTAGYRPCRRCRPELAPDVRLRYGRDGLLTAALGELTRHGDAAVPTLAARIGVSDRHLRRLFADQFGATPVQMLATQRVLLAKQLIEASALSMTNVAFASGYSSVRRFNTAVRAAFDRTPSHLRAAGDGSNAPGLRLRLPLSPPYDSAALLGFLGGRAFPGVESVNAACYARLFQIDGKHGAVEIDFSNPKQLTLHAHLTEPRQLPSLVAIVRRVFDLDAPIAAIAAHLNRDASLRRALKRNPGIRVPGAWAPFELAVRAILGQQVSVKAASTLAARLVTTYGARIAINGVSIAGLDRYFPEPLALVDAPLEALGIVRARAHAIRALAQATIADPDLFNAQQSTDGLIARLVALPGIGPWTAHYVALRGLSEPDAFPTGDLGLIRSYARLSGKPISARELDRVAEAWRPWRSYAALLLWLDEARVSGSQKGG